MKQLLRVAAFSAALTVAFSACHHTTTQSASDHHDETSDVTTTSGAISANPNPVPAGSGKGETTITWHCDSSSWSQVYVSTNGKPEQLFSGGKSGEKKAPWIQTGGHYEFRLYEGKAHQKLLGKVDVTRPS